MGIIILIILGIIFIIVMRHLISVSYNKKKEKEGEELSRGKPGLYLSGEYFYENGERVINSFPVYKNKYGRYCKYDTTETEYVGYCDKGRFDRKKAKDGGCGRFDKHGNRFVPQYTKSYNNEEPSNATNQNNGYYEEEERREVNHRVDWREDGSYGDIYDNGYQQTDQWGNPLY